MLTLFAQATTAAAGPTLPTSGDFWNPANWTEFVKVIGIPGFFAFIFLGVILYLLWRQSKQPSNAEQLEVLLRQTALMKFMVEDSRRRTVRMQTVLRGFCGVCEAFAALNPAIAIKDKLDKIQDALYSEPPAIPADLLVDLDTKEK